MHFAIVEDLESDQHDLKELIRQNFAAERETPEFSCFCCGEDFLAAFRPMLYNVVFLDIVLGTGRINGIETARRLREADSRLPIIFTTTEKDYALDSYRVHPLDYLIKPIKKEQLDWCLQELRETEAVPQFLAVQEIGGQGLSIPRTIMLDSLLYAETIRHGLIIHTAEGDVTTRMTFSELVQRLPQNGRFYVSGRGLLLNFSQIKNIRNDGEVILKNGQHFFSTKRKAKETQLAFTSYIFNSLRHEH